MAREAKIPEVDAILNINRRPVVTAAAIGLVRTAVANVVIPDRETEETIGQSYLGTPVIDNLEFPTGSYTDLKGNLIEYPEISVDTVVFEVNRPRRIIKTPIQGRDGDVKEYISNMDFTIVCNGKISSEQDIRPIDAIRSLRLTLDAPQQLPIVSGFLNEIFDIFNIVIENYSIKEAVGVRNQVEFSFNAVSDVGLEVTELG